MKAPKTSCPSAQRGDSLIEILVTLVILMIGLLGLVGLLLQSQRSQMESYQRVQALMMMEDMVSRINTNRKAASCYAITTNGSSPFLGTGSSLIPGCTTGTAEQQALATSDMSAWNSLLLGSDEKLSGSNVGGILNARGCVELVSPGVYQVSVVWQGNSKTAAPSGISCASGQYGDDTQRRGVSAHVQIASLS